MIKFLLDMLVWENMVNMIIQFPFSNLFFEGPLKLLTFLRPWFFLPFWGHQGHHSSPESAQHQLVRERALNWWEKWVEKSIFLNHILEAFIKYGVNESVIIFVITWDYIRYFKRLMFKWTIVCVIFCLVLCLFVSTRRCDILQPCHRDHRWQMCISRWESMIIN